MYSQIGRPADVMRALTSPSLAPPALQTVNARFVLSPINSADMNVVEGVYPRGRSCLPVANYEFGFVSVRKCMRLVACAKDTNTQFHAREGTNYSIHLCKGHEY